MLTSTTQLGGNIGGWGKIHRITGKPLGKKVDEKYLRVVRSGREKAKKKNSKKGREQKKKKKGAKRWLSHYLEGLGKKDGA